MLRAACPAGRRYGRWRIPADTSAAGWPGYASHQLRPPRWKPPVRRKPPQNGARDQMALEVVLRGKAVRGASDRLWFERQEPGQQIRFLGRGALPSYDLVAIATKPFLGLRCVGKSLRVERG